MRTDWTDAQADLSLRWAHMSFCCFCRAAAQLIMLRKDIQDVGVTRIVCGAVCWTDHRPVVTKINLRIHPARRPQSNKDPSDVSKVEQDRKRQSFVSDICNSAQQGIQIFRNALNSLAGLMRMMKK